jgi:hypothetical protein
MCVIVDSERLFGFRCFLLAAAQAASAAAFRIPPGTIHDSSTVVVHPNLKRAREYGPEAGTGS